MVAQQLTISSSLPFVLAAWRHTPSSFLPHDVLHCAHLCGSCGKDRLGELTFAFFKLHPFCWHLQLTELLEVDLVCCCLQLNDSSGVYPVNLVLMTEPAQHSRTQA